VRPDAMGAENALKAGAAARDQLGVSRARVQERADGARRDAGAARAAADAAAKTVNEALVTMAKARADSEGLTLAGKTPIDHFQSAVTSAAGAIKHLGSTVGPTVSASIGAYNQKLGDLYVQRARALTLQTETLRILTAAKPALPLGGDLSGRITESDEAARKAADDAKNAFENAKAAFEKAGARGENKEAFEKIAASLDRLMKAETAPAPAAMDKTAAKGTDPAAGAAMGSEADVAAVREAMTRVITMLKDGKASELGTVVVAEQRSFVESALTPFLKIGALDDACREKFSKSVFDVVKGSPLGMMLGMMAPGIDQVRQIPRTMADMKPESLTIKMVSATRAEITGSGQELTEMIKEGNDWKLRMPFPEGMDAMGAMGAMPGADKLMAKIGDAVAEVTVDLKAGKFETTEALSAALNAKLMPVIQGGMMPPGGG
ncbi:MAG: hypothetical protein ACT4PL_14175, partial [Phycisphaerales bacterium]